MSIVAPAVTALTAAEIDYNSNNNGGPGVTSSEDFEFWWSYNQTHAKTVQVGTCVTKLQSFPTVRMLPGNWRSRRPDTRVRLDRQ